MDTLLTSWGFTSLIEPFKKNDILSIECLIDILENVEEAKCVIPSAGLRVLVRKKLQEHIELNNSISIEFDTNAELKEFDCERKYVARTESPVDISNQPCWLDEPRELERSLSTNTDTSIQEVASKKLKIGVQEVVQNFDLKAALEGDALGPSIIKIYDVKQELCSIAQSYLVDIIVLYFLKDSSLQLTNADFSVLADKIVELFPLECPKTYYVDPVKKCNTKNKDKSVRSRGKLVDKYRNRRTFILDVEKLQIGCTVPTVMLENNSDATDYLNSKNWLRINREPTEILKHWNLTYSLRESDIKNNEYKVLSDIYNNWPILEESSGYELIERDFFVKHSITFDQFSLRWNATFKEAIKLFNKISNDEQLIMNSLNQTNSDYDTFMQLKLLNSLLAPKSNRICLKTTGKKKSFWKPSKIEAEEGIAVHIKIPGDIENEVLNKIKKMSEMKLSVQPFVILVGPNVSQIDKCYVRVDRVMYEMPSLLRALDILFKIYVTFNVSYPGECEKLCYFVQWAIYGIFTDSDVQIPAVCTLVNKIQKRLNAN